MRLSVDQDDPGFSPDAIRATVYLNGEKLNLCITADEERGECLCYDEDARPSGNFAPTILRKGEVKIVLD